MNSHRRPARIGAAPAFALAVLGTAAGLIPVAQAADSAVVFMYHRFGESAFPSTNIRIEQFEAHLKEFTSGRYTVLPLPDIVARLKAREPLPDYAVAITIDDAFASVFHEAWPRLREAGLPFTLFLATEPIDNRTDGMMSWDQIRSLAAAGVTIGAHSATHAHMPDQDAAVNRAEIERSNARFLAELGFIPALFAYPYGEASRAIAQMAAETGRYVAAFGQHSGVAHPDGNLFYLPRFAINEHYGTLDRVRLAARALALPVRDVAPADPLLGPRNNPPAFGFTVDDEIARGVDRLACYSSHAGRARIERLGERRVEVRVGKPFPPGRGRVNCTLPGPDGRWRWFGMQFYVPRPPR